MKHRSVAVAALALLPLAASAQEGDRRFYVSPMFSYVFEDGARGLQNGLGGQLAIGKKVTNSLNLEVTGYYTTAGKDIGDDARASFTSLGGGVMLFPSSTMHWLFVELAGYSNWGRKQYGIVSDYRSTVFDSGLGVLVPLGFDGNGFVPDGTSLRVDARYRYDQHGEPNLGKGGEEDAYDVAVNVGLLIPLTHTAKAVTEAPTPAPEVVPTEAPADADSDGVADNTDQCPDTPAGSTVDEKGCPAEAAPAAATTDCAVPGPGQQANLQGCKEGQAIVLSGVNFETGKATLTGPAKTILDSVADALKTSADIKVEIGGHTDNVGSEASNQKLSERRAKAVKKYLVGKGTDAGRLGTKGYGSLQPLVANDTPEGREQNRRVEFKVVNEVSADATPAPAATPAATETAPSTTETAPAATESAPATTETAPSTPETAPGTTETAPSTPETAPGTTETAPSTPETAPSTPETAPSTPSSESAPSNP